MISPKEWKKAKKLAGEKYCPGCETYKHTSDFHSDVNVSSGLSIYCKPCRLKMGTAWKIKNSDKVRDISRRRKYKGYTEEHGKIMSCEICSVDLVVGRRVSNKQCIDHNHETGIIRGVLCNNCNAILGYSRDNPEILREAARYLEERTS